MIDCLIEVAVFTVCCCTRWDGLWTRPTLQRFRQISYKPEQQSNLPPHFLKTKKRRVNVTSAEELCTWLCRPRHGAFWRQNWKDLWDIYRQHSFSLSCETAPNSVLQDTWTNNNGKQIIRLVTFDRNKKLLGSWYTYVTACKQCFNN